MGVFSLLPKSPLPSSAPFSQAVLREIQDAVARAGQVVREAVGDLQTVRSFGAEEEEVCRYKEALERCRQLWWRRDLEQALYLLLRRVRKLGEGPREGQGKAGVLVLQLLLGSLPLTGREGREWKVLRLPFLLPPDAELGNEGAVAELWAAAGPGWDVTQGGLLSFLLYQENLGSYKQVSRELCRLSFPPPCFPLWLLGLGFYLFLFKIQKTKPNKNEITLICLLWRISNRCRKPHPM